MTREDIIIAARSWIGTRFHHQGRVKKTDNHLGGCDCIGLILGIADDIGAKFNNNLLSFYDNNCYSKRPTGLKLQENLDKYLQIVNNNEYCIGDIALISFVKDPQHVAVISSYSKDSFSIIHSYIKARGVVEHYLDANWLERIVRVYRFNELRD